MEKEIVRINENDIREMVKEATQRIMEKRELLNEMARLNKKDGSQSPFPSNKYKIWVQGDNSPHKPAHMHIWYPQDGWQIKVFIANGELWEVVSHGNRGEKDGFVDVIKMVKEWFAMPTTMPGRVGTNQEAAQYEWEACNDD